MNIDQQVLEFMEPPLENKMLYIAFSKHAADYWKKLTAFNAGPRQITVDGTLARIMERHGFRNIIHPSATAEDRRETLVTDATAAGCRIAVDCSRSSTVRYRSHPQYSRNFGKSRKSEASLAQGLRLV